MKDKNYTAYFERFTIDMSKEQALSCSHVGDCYQDVKDMLPELSLDINPELVRAELKEYGAWDEIELSDDSENLIRIAWIAAGNIKEEYSL
jgi:hypothetical protein